MHLQVEGLSYTWHNFVFISLLLSGINLTANANNEEYVNHIYYKSRLFLITHICVLFEARMKFKIKVAHISILDICT